MTLKAILHGAGRSLKLRPAVPRLGVADPAQHQAQLAEFREAMTAATTFDGQAALVEDDARQVIDEGGRGVAVEHAEHALKAVAYARLARDKGALDEAMRWALEAGGYHALMWAVRMAGRGGRQAVKAKGASKHDPWRAEAERIRAGPRGGELSLTRIAQLVKRKLDLSVSVETVRKVIGQK